MIEERRSIRVSGDDVAVLVGFGDADQILLAHWIAADGAARSGWHPARRLVELESDLLKLGFRRADAAGAGAMAQIEVEVDRRRPETTVFVRREPDPAREAALKAAIEVTETVRFWGADHVITPVLAESILGDGRRLLTVHPVNGRPNHYVVRVDSSWADDPSERIDDLIEVLDEEFGPARYTDDDGADIVVPWPAFDDEYGIVWRKAKWPTGLEPEPEAEERLSASRM